MHSNNNRISSACGTHRTVVPPLQCTLQAVVIARHARSQDNDVPRLKAGRHASRDFRPGTVGRAAPGREQSHLRPTNEAAVKLPWGTAVPMLASLVKESLAPFPNVAHESRVSWQRFGPKQPGTQRPNTCRCFAHLAARQAAQQQRDAAIGPLLGVAWVGGLRVGLKRRPGLIHSNDAGGQGADNRAAGRQLGAQQLQSLSRKQNTSRFAARRFLQGGTCTENGRVQDDCRPAQLIQCWTRTSTASRCGHLVLGVR